MGINRRRKSGMQEAMNSKGLTLIEMVIALLIFSLVLGISINAFQQLIKKGSLQGKTAESNIEGIVGLEIMRTDVSHAGYGLPWAFQITPTYANGEVTTANSLLATTEVDSASLNDSTNPAAIKVPRAIMSKAGATTGIDYLVIKGTILGTSDKSKRWNFVSYSGSSTNKSWLKSRTAVANDPTSDTNLQQNDLVITLISSFSSSGAETRNLMAKSATDYSYAVPGPVSGVVTAPAGYQPTDFSDTVVAYGINPASGVISMPYNRVDYYVNKGAAKPVSCAPGTGVLFKAVANHAGGFINPYPLLDCVGDMQVVYYRDQNNDGNLNPIDDTTIATMTDADIHEQIKEARVFILTHEGKKDTGFSYPPIDATNAVCVAPRIDTTGSCVGSVGRLWGISTGTWNMKTTFGTDWNRYRWKVLTFTVSLKNLQ
jgi:prepilin-type N-terminal cleavage/methylation domain-containing protein